MKDWLLGIVATVLLLILLEMLLSEGTTKKYIKGILHLIIIIVMILPLINLSKNSADYKNIINGNTNLNVDTLEISDEDQKKITDVQIVYIKKTLESYLFNRGIDCEVNIIIQNNYPETIEIFIYDIGINGQNKNIYTNEKIKSMVQEVINTDINRIVIYEKFR